MPLAAAHTNSTVIPGLAPGIHDFGFANRGLGKKTWMAGASPAMTVDD
jgi:hypothetical protein